MIGAVEAAGASRRSRCESCWARKVEGVTASSAHVSLRTYLHATAQAAVTPILVALAYYLGAEAAFGVGTLSDRIFAPFWPPNIVLLCALLLLPPRRWWIVLAAALPA